MSFDLDALDAAIRDHGAVARVVVAASRGSAPREVGASMLVWDGGQSGTIGGGTLEFEAARAAREGQVGPIEHPLGPALGQCCGGSVTILTEHFTAETPPMAKDGVVARPVRGRGDNPPFSVKRLLATARGQGKRPAPQLIDGWMVEPVQRPDREFWIWGAGHVGRALVDVIAPLPGVCIHWVDTAPNRFPAKVPDNLTVIPAADPSALVRHCPAHADHLILTYSHALDLELCHRLLGHRFGSIGLIGSATKWARFRSRLAQLGHYPDRIAQIACPIGDPGLGKHPRMIAIGVAAAFLRQSATADERKDETA
ncbi:MAG: xanthine dehydrogenase accessory protein XdhC [Pseudomonadota bacterium]